MKKKLLIVFCLLSVKLIICGAVLACVGARPLAMGASFTGVADDIHAVYWNPAGLVQLEATELTWTRTLNNRDLFNYDDFLAIAACNKELGLAYAVGYINVADYYPIGYLEDLTLVYQDEKIRWLILSLAKSFNDQLSIGGNIRHMTHGLRYEAASYQPISDSASFFAIDLSVFYKATEDLRLGLLIQDFNRPEFSFFNNELRYYCIRNVRPGISYKITDSLLVTASIYDLLDEAGMPERFRLGIEQQIDNIFIRVGSDRGNKTFGLGVKMPCYELDYALLGDDLGDTHMLGLTYRF